MQLKEFKDVEDFINDIKDYKITMKDRIYMFFSSIKHFCYDFKEGIKNLIKYFKLIWKDRWWDYYYLEELILFKLKDMENKWGNETHYVGDKFTKKRLQVLIKKLEELKKMEEDLELDINKKREKVYKLLGKNLGRFWD
jgi:hypothetical protein